MGFIRVSMCAAAGAAAASALTTCPTLSRVAAALADNFAGDYTIFVSAPAQAGTYQVVTSVNGAPLREAAYTISVVPPLANGTSLAPVPAPAPAPSNVTQILTGIQLLGQTQTLNGANLAFRYRDSKGVPTAFLQFLAVVSPAPGVVSVTPPAQFRSFMPGSDYNVTVALRTSGSYSLALYKCAQMSCVDVSFYVGRVNSTLTPLLTVPLVIPTGALSPQNTTVNSPTSFAQNDAGTFTVTARDLNGLIRSQERDAARFAVTADHGLTGGNFTDQQDGTYVFRFVPTEVARYTFTVYIVSLRVSRRFGSCLQSLEIQHLQPLDSGGERSTAKDTEPGCY